MKRVSIKDIARQAGVVPSTVSFVLNGKDKEMRISQVLTDKIKAIIEETGYYPNQTAVSLRTGKTKIIGMLVEDISNVFFSSLARIIEDEAYAIGYKIVYCSTENNDDKGIELIRMLCRQQVDGFLITPSAGMLKEIQKLVEQKMPVVLMDRYFPELDIPYALVDNLDGVKAGITHLVERGYKNIAFVTVDLNQLQMKQREKGYLEALIMNKVKTGNKYILTIPYMSKPAQYIEAITLFIKRNPEIDAVFFATNYLGVYGLQSLRMLQLSIPADVAVVCFDDHDIFRFYSPSITVISQPIEIIAKTAIHLLVNQLEKGENYPNEKGVFSKAQLILRDSS